jgi:hypothetical protein
MIKYFIILVTLLTQLFSIPPEWYLSLDKKPETIYGYGKDINPQKAKKLAKHMIQLRIDHRLIPNYLTFLKQSKKDGITYVAYSYNTQTLYNKIYNKKHLIRSSKKPNNQLIKNSSIYRNIVYRLQLKPYLSLIKEDNSWYLLIDENKFYVDVLHFPKLFSNIQHNDLKFTINKRVLKYPDTIQFEIKSKEKGYVSILYSSSYGKVKSIISNEKISEKTYLYPTNNIDKLTVYNQSEDDLKELYIAIFSKEPLDLYEFEFLEESALLDGSNYNFDKLLHILQENRFSTIKVRIKPNGKNSMKKEKK